MKMFRNKVFFVCMSAAVFLVVLSVVLAAMGRADLLKNAVLTVTQPVRWTVSRIADAADGFGDYFGASKQLKEENESLREALVQAGNAELDVEIYRAENERLRAYLGVKSAHPDFTFEEATVIGRSTEKYVSVLMLNRGTAHGIRVNMPVLTADGLCGYVTEVGLTWCKVVTILSGENSVGVYVERSGVLGVLTGGSAGSGTCTMQYIETNSDSARDPETDTDDTDTETDTDTAVELELPYGADIREGDRILTTGVGAVYPGGLTVGRVTALTLDPYNRRLTATVTPAANLSRDLSFVMILTGEGGETEP